MRGSWLVAVLLLVLLGATLVAYLPAFDGPFVFDDVENIAKNPLVRDLHWILAPWSAAQSGATPYVLGTFRTRFVAFATFALDYRFQGPQPRGFHRTNLAIHLLATLLVFALTRRLLALPLFLGSRAARSADAIALLAAALFALHPLQTQAVSYIVQRMASLAACLGLAAALCYLKARTATSVRESWAWTAACLASLGAAMLTKQNALTFPLLLGLIELAFLREVAGRRRLLWPVVATLVLLPALTLWRAVQTGSSLQFLARSLHGGAATEAVPYRDFLFSQPRVLIAYLRLFIWPAGQSIDHAVAVSTSVFDPRTLAALAILVALVGLALWLWRLGPSGEPGWRLSAFGILWFFVALAVEAGLFPIQDLMAEHRLYMPLVGLAIAAAAASASLPSLVARRVGLAVLTVALVPLAAATRARNEVWRDDLALWRDAERGNPRSPRVLFNIGETLIERGDIAGGEVYLRRTLEVSPGFAPALANLGTIAASRGDLVEARRLLEGAYEAEPANWIAAVNLGDLALRRRDLPAARRYYEAAVQAASWEPIPRQRLSTLEELERRSTPLSPR